MFLRKQGYHVTNFARKTKVSSYNCGVKKVKLSRFQAQRINEFNFEVEAHNFEFTKHVSDGQHPSSVANTNEPLNNDVKLRH